MEGTQGAGRGERQKGKGQGRGSEENTEVGKGPRPPWSCQGTPLPESQQGVGWGSLEEAVTRGRLPAPTKPHPACEKLQAPEGGRGARGRRREGGLHSHDKGQQWQQQQRVEGQQGLEEEEVGENAGAELAPDPLQGVVPGHQGLQPREQREPQVVRRLWGQQQDSPQARLERGAGPQPDPGPGLERRGSGGAAARGGGVDHTQSQAEG